MSQDYKEYLCWLDIFLMRGLYCSWSPGNNTGDNLSIQSWESSELTIRIKSLQRCKGFRHLKLHLYLKHYFINHNKRLQWKLSLHLRMIWLCVCVCGEQKARVSDPWLTPCVTPAVEQGEQKVRKEWERWKEITLSNGSDRLDN